MDTNKKTFKLLKRVSASFSAVVTGFSVVTTLLFRIRDRIEFTFIMSLISKLTTTVNLKRVRLNFGTVKLITAPLITINTKRVKLTYNLKERLKFTLTVLLKNRITWGMSMRQKLISTIGVKKVKITFNPSIFEFLKLLTFDPQTLATLDTEALGEMDYNGWTP